VSANLDLVRSIYADWERGDFSHGEWADPEIEVVSPDHAFGGYVVKGRAEVARRWSEFLSAWEEWRYEVDEYRQLDGHRVLVLARLRGRGKTSGVDIGELQTNVACVVHIDAGKVSKLVMWSDRDGALADLGLEE
jgi:hypothetical protein